MYKFSSSFFARFDNSVLAFSFVIILRESPRNSWINNYIKVFLSSTIATVILSTARIQITLDVRFAHDAAQPSS